MDHYEPSPDITVETPITDPRHLRFIAEYMSNGCNQAGAYTAAYGLKPSQTHYAASAGYRLIRRDDIAAEVHRRSLLIEEETAFQHRRNGQWVVDRLTAIAAQSVNLPAANSALKLLGMHYGIYEADHQQQAEGRSLASVLAGIDGTSAGLPQLSLDAASASQDADQAGDQPGPATADDA